jgi:hypothetical protein
VATCWLTADWVYPSESAAALNVPSSTTASSATSWRVSQVGTLGVLML